MRSLKKWGRKNWVDYIRCTVCQKSQHKTAFFRPVDEETPICKKCWPKEIPRMSPRCLRGRFKGRLKLNNCLKCGRKFSTVDNYRICAPCKSTTEWRNSVEYYEVIR